MADLRWYINRLAVMSPRELQHRLLERVRIETFRRRKPARTPTALSRFCNASTPQLPSLNWAESVLRAEKDRILSGSFPALGFQWRFPPASEQLDDHRIWHEAPDTGNVWPRSFFHDIDHRAGNAIGDVRVVWEPSRLQQLVEIAALYGSLEVEAEREAAVRLFQRQLESWYAANPPYLGVHYVSAMECALRIIALIHAFDLLRDSKLARNSWQRLMELVESHARLIERRLSLHSSAGNHTVAEAAGLLYAGLLFEELPGSNGRVTLARQLLRQEVGRQVLPDGGSIEQSLWYLLFVVQLAELAERLHQHRVGHGLGLDRLVAAGYDHLNTYACSLDDLPHFGDCDGGWALSRHWRPERLGCRSGEGPVLRTFPDTGQSVARTADGTRLTFDHGPLGMSPGFGHGHADALQVTLSVKGIPLLIDPGTYSYAGSEGWRRYFRGTSAHNTVSVGGQDQAHYLASFQWSRPYRSQLADSWQQDGWNAWLAWHDGYAGLRHWRLVLFDLSIGVIVGDLLDGSTMPGAELHWHCHPDVDATQDSKGSAGWLSAAGVAPQAIRVRWQIRGDEQPVTVSRGRSEPPLGWCSLRYGVKRPTTTLRGGCRSDDLLAALSTFVWSEALTDADARQLFDSARSRAERLITCD